MQFNQLFENQYCRRFSNNDYYPFGMGMPGREYTAGSGYRYGFNGKEKSDEVYGDGNSYDYGARMYDSRVGRWLSADPRKDKYTSWSPFHFGFDNPITTIDPNGEENIVVVGTQHDNAAGNKLMFVHQGLRQLKEYSQNEKGESRSLVIFTQGYTPRQLKRIEQQAAKLGATVVKISSAEQLTSYINTKNSTGIPTPAREADKVTNIDAFSHGVVGAIEFGYHINAGEKTNTSMTFNSTSAANIDKKAFAESAVFASYACRTGIGNAKIDKIKYPWESTMQTESLAQDIANCADITVKAFCVRSDYENTLSTFQDRLYMKLYKQTGMGAKNKSTIDWYNQWQERLKKRENIDGATFDPDGAVHPVEGGNTPRKVDSSQKTFVPKKE